MSLTPNNLNDLSDLTDPLNNNVAYEYDRSGNLIKVTLPNGKEQNFTYNNAYLLTRKSLDVGKYFDYSYDGANNLTRVTDQDTTKRYTWTYDNVGRVCDSRDTFYCGLGYFWDNSNNLTQISSAIGISYYPYTKYTYGQKNNLLTITLPDGQIISYNYDGSGRVFQIRYPEYHNYRNISYLPNGWVNSIQDPRFPGSYKYYYVYNDDGNISTISSWAGQESFIYDAGGRLTTWNLSPRSGSPVQENYQYDNAGNLLTKGPSTYTYDSANRITNSGFTYDNNGNLTRDGTYIYDYDAENKLTEVRRVSDSSLVATYTYNFDGTRRSKTVYSGSTSKTTSYNWDAFGQLIRESDTAGNITFYYYDNKGNLIGLRKNNLSCIVRSNLRGDVVSVTNTSSGGIYSQYHYDPWGNRINTFNDSVIQPFRYAGYYYDQETELYYCKNRYYSPTLGRFLTKDSISYIKYENPQTLNLYAYAENNPVINVDPTGSIAVADDTAVFLGGLAVLAGLTIAANAGNPAAIRARESLIKSCNDSIARLKEKAKTITGPEGVQYTLRATVSGDYFLNLRTGEPVHLEAGDIYKIGETTDPAGRYSKAWLEGSNLKFYPEFYGNQIQIKIAERERLLGYVIKHGNLPPGNKICR